MQTIQDVQRLTYDVIHRFCTDGVWSQLLRCSFGDLTHLGSCRNPDFKARADAFTLATAASEKRPCLSWSFMKAQCRRQEILFWTLESSFSTRFLACATRYLREMSRFQTCGKYSSSAILSRNLVGHLWGRVMVTHNWCINEWCPQNGSANFRRLDNVCWIQPSLLDNLLQDEQIAFWIVSLFPFAFFVLWFFRVLRVPSGRLLLLGPLAGAVNDSVDDLPPADPRLCPFEPPTPQWSLGWSIRMHKGQRCENFLKTQQILILDMDDILDIWI